MNSDDELDLHERLAITTIGYLLIIFNLSPLFFG